jgi:hypothetical protein
MLCFRLLNHSGVPLKAIWKYLLHLQLELNLAVLIRRIKYYIEKMHTGTSYLVWFMQMLIALYFSRKYYMIYLLLDTKFVHMHQFMSFCFNGFYVTPAKYRPYGNVPVQLAPQVTLCGLFQARTRTWVELSMFRKLAG